MKAGNENILKAVLALMSMTFLIYIGTTIFKYIRVDMTQENLYTLSQGSKNILKKINTPITLKLYYSKTAANKGTEGLRVFNNHFVYVRDLLEEYKKHSRNNIEVEVIDPRPDTEEESDAIAHGLRKFHLTETERYFFGLVAQTSNGSEKIIEFFDPGQKDNLEYEITKLIYTTINPQKKNVGILSSIDIVNQDMNPYMAQLMQVQGKQVQDSWIITKLLEEYVNVSVIEKDSEKISGIDVLIIVHPRDFSEKIIKAIDKYIYGGGKLLVFLDPNLVSDRSHAVRGISKSPGTNFKKLMDKWGIILKKNHYAGDKYLSGVGQTSPGMPPSRLLAIVNCDDRCADKYNDNISSNLNQATLIFPGVLEIKESDNVKYSPILGTTDKGNSYQASQFELNNPRALWNKFDMGENPVIMAYKGVGKFNSAFPKNVENIKQSEAAIVVFSDVDFIADQFAFKRSFLGVAKANDNSTLFLNAVEALSGDVNLMSVRSKGAINRSFDVIENIEFEAQKRTSSKVKEINANIARYQSEINSLGKNANKDNIALIQNEGVKKKKELLKKVAVLKNELREVKRVGREKVERIGEFFQYLNTLFIPILVVVFGLIYSHRRNKLMKIKKMEVKG